MKNTTLLLLIIIFYNCKDTEKAISNITEEIHIDVESHHIKNIDELFDSTNYVRLETNKMSMFGEVGKLIIYKEKIYILDKKATKNIFVFNMEGRFQYELLKIGNGPGEVKDPVDFNIKNDNLYVLDRDFKKIFIYNLKGKFIKDNRLDIRLLNFEFLNNGEIIALKELSGIKNNKDAGKLVHYSLKSSKVLCEFDIRQVANHGNLKLDNVFSSHGNNVLYWEIFSNSIYNYTQGKIRIKYQIDFGRFNIGDDILKLPLEKKISQLTIEKKKYAGIVDNIIDETGRLFFTFIHDSEIYNVIYDKISKESEVYLLIDKLKGIKTSRIFTKTNNYYGLIVYPKDLYKESNFLNEMDNPMIIICK